MTGPQLGPAPDFREAVDLQQFTEVLMRLKAWSGRSYPAIAGKPDRKYAISHGTAENVVKGHTAPKDASVMGFVTGCGIPEDEAVHWVEHYRSLRAAAPELEPSSPEKTGPEPKSLEKPGPEPSSSGLGRRTWLGPRKWVIAACVAVLVVGGGAAFHRPHRSLVDATSFSGFSDDGVPPRVLVDGGTLTITPKAGYDALRGAMATKRLCNASVDLSVRLAEPAAPSAGYGLGIGAHVTVQDGTFAGWTLQLERDPSRAGLVARPVILPHGAWQQSLPGPVAMTTEEWHRIHLDAGARTSAVTVDGQAVPGSPFVSSPGCGFLLLRVWGTTVTVTDIDVR